MVMREILLSTINPAPMEDHFKNVFRTEWPTWQKQGSRKIGSDKSVQDTHHQCPRHGQDVVAEEVLQVTDHQQNLVTQHQKNFCSDYLKMYRKDEKHLKYEQHITEKLISADALIL